MKTESCSYIFGGVEKGKDVFGLETVSA